ncbi:hypothetical protein O181_030047 [Austropuccinia psidii MF-1]|uniref:Uncharacterized protein n=1 Tax=Austropuccinia psidii MF-1 TaxID=1389203 RepID=A0A9Q3H425_9BASI|nr:hypothetical protein [Austropuccinia psidii MF-1]
MPHPNVDEEFVDCTHCAHSTMRSKKTCQAIGWLFKLSTPSNHAARGVPAQDSFVVYDDESIPKQEWRLGHQTGRQEQFWKIIPVPSSIDLSTPPPRPPSNGRFTS